MGTQIAAQVGGTLAYLVEAVERRIVPVLARTRHDGRFGGALHCDRHPSESRVAVQRAESGERSAGESAFSIVFSRISIWDQTRPRGANLTSRTSKYRARVDKYSVELLVANSGRKKLDSERQSGPKAGGFACSRCRGELPAA